MKSIIIYEAICLHRMIRIYDFLQYGQKRPRDSSICKQTPSRRLGRLEYRQHDICKQIPVRMHYKPMLIIEREKAFVNIQCMDEIFETETHLRNYLPEREYSIIGSRNYEPADQDPPVG